MKVVLAFIVLSALFANPDLGHAHRLDGGKLRPGEYQRLDGQLLFWGYSTESWIFHLQGPEKLHFGEGNAGELVEEFAPTDEQGIPLAIDVFYDSGWEEPGIASHLLEFSTTADAAILGWSTSQSVDFFPLHAAGFSVISSGGVDELTPHQWRSFARDEVLALYYQDLLIWDLSVPTGQSDDLVGTRQDSDFAWKHSFVQVDVGEISLLELEWSGSTLGDVLFVELPRSIVPVKWILDGVEIKGKELAEGYRLMLPRLNGGAHTLKIHITAKPPALAGPVVFRAHWQEQVASLAANVSEGWSKSLGRVEVEIGPGRSLILASGREVAADPDGIVRLELPPGLHPLYVKGSIVPIWVNVRPGVVVLKPALTGQGNNRVVSGFLQIKQTDTIWWDVNWGTEANVQLRSTPSQSTLSGELPKGGWTWQRNHNGVHKFKLNASDLKGIHNHGEWAWNIQPRRSVGFASFDSLSARLYTQENQYPRVELWYGQGGHQVGTDLSQIWFKFDRYGLKGRVSLDSRQEIRANLRGPGNIPWSLDIGPGNRRQLEIAREKEGARLRLQMELTGKDNWSGQLQYTNGVSLDMQVQSSEGASRSRLRIGYDWRLPGASVSSALVSFTSPFVSVVAVENRVSIMLHPRLEVFWDTVLSRSSARIDWAIGSVCELLPGLAAKIQYSPDTGLRGEVGISFPILGGVSGQTTK